MSQVTLNVGFFSSLQVKDIKDFTVLAPHKIDEQR